MGKYVTKGSLKGFPIFTVTLEERKTCPSHCHHWNECYGNNSLFSHRARHGSSLQAHIKREIQQISKKYPNGFLVRLHILGDFYSASYVGMWLELMMKFPNLHVFGYTARDKRDGAIWNGLVRLRETFGKRWMVRHSGEPMNGYDIFAVREESESDSIVCPQQEGKTAGCSTCSLCWETFKSIKFLTH